MRSFLDACGARGPLLWAVERNGSAEVEHLAVDSPVLLVGRDPAADLCLRHPDVGGRHAYLQLVEGRLFCADLGSRTGTFLHGRRRRTAWVGLHEPVRIGPYRVRLAAGAREDPQPPLNSDGKSETPAQPRLSLELAHRSIRASACPVAEPIVLVGSAADCRARLLDPSLAEYHCSLIPAPEGAWVVDLLGPGGLTINGSPARVGRVYEGDVLGLGGSTVRLRSGAGAVEEPSRADDQAKAPPLDLSPLLAGLAPEHAELARSLLIPLLNQLGLMQQQMLDRANRAADERLDALRAHQQEQFRALREELELLRELRQDLDELKAQGRTPGRTPSAAASRPRLGSATPAARSAPPALAPPEMLRLSVGEAS